MNIRTSIAIEVSAQIGAIVLDQMCTCGWPLLEKPEQGLPFCWGCVTDRTCAQRGRTVLAKTKLAASGIHLGPHP